MPRCALPALEARERRAAMRFAAYADAFFAPCQPVRALYASLSALLFMMLRADSGFMLCHA